MLAIPEVLVVAVPVALAPIPGGVSVTVAFGTALPNWSVTFTCRSSVKAVLTVALWLLPPKIVKALAAPGLLVRSKLTAVSPVELAVTVWTPATVLAVRVLAVAVPAASVVTGVAAKKLAAAPVEPVLGVKVTSTPGRALLAKVSTTCACKFVAKSLSTMVLWLSPATALKAKLWTSNAPISKVLTTRVAPRWSVINVVVPPASRAALPGRRAWFG